jgi:hypothetical protein
MRREPAFRPALLTVALFLCCAAIAACAELLALSLEGLR